MSYYAGINIYNLVENTDGTVCLLADDTYGDDLYVTGRKKLHTEWGTLCHMSFKPYTRNDMNVVSYFVVFDEPDLAGKIVKVSLMDSDGKEVSKQYYELKSTSYAAFERSVMEFIADHKAEKATSRQKTVETYEASIADYNDRIDKALHYQTQVASEEVFKLFQKQIDSYYEDLKTLKSDYKDLLDYYDSGEYDDDYGYSDSLLKFLEVAKTAMAAGKIVSVYGE